jgi:hypothetical protein
MIETPILFVIAVLAIAALSLTEGILTPVVIGD